MVHRLITAATRGDINRVQQLLAAGDNVNLTRKGGQTALFWASVYGRLEMVELLLAHGADPTRVVFKWGWTAIESASKHGHLKIVELLLAKGADINHEDKLGGTALWKASDGGHFEVVKLLLAHNADVNHTDTDGETALHAASRHGHLATVELLLSSGADEDIVSETAGAKAIDLANGNNHQEVVNYFVRRQLSRRQWFYDYHTFQCLPGVLKQQCTVLATIWSAHFGDFWNIIHTLPIELLHELLRELLDMYSSYEAK